MRASGPQIYFKRDFQILIGHTYGGRELRFHESVLTFMLGGLNSADLRPRCLLKGINIS